MRRGFPGGSIIKESPYNAGDMGLTPEMGKSLEKEWQPPLVFLLGKSHGQRSLTSWVTGVRHDVVSKPPPPLGDKVRNSSS